MSERKGKLRQIVDWSAAVWAGLVGGTVFLLLNLLVTPSLVGGDAWFMVRLLASVILGDAALVEPAFSWAVLVAGLGSHYALSVGFALFLAFVIHRWGLLVGILGGALFGLVLYAINFYTLTLFFPWFFAFRSWPMIATHVIFGAVVGGTYEGLEVELFVREVQDEEEAGNA